ncbi:putative quinol monooxygenase [Muriicola marianensis]|uniref:Antibiotic biosynthesis monooxygenase n=1 Tax=Muriicola marianensis TaxID=1324801 RepID=A0ABQ1R055_9FLAO|nr:putative quinol monooxygenase [Muriicola marianensis]GGD53387.1 antibiotic biosynthesis monooxygenase [Muriicola marianensis]
MKSFTIIAAALLLCLSCHQEKPEVHASQPEKMMVRIAEIEVAPEYLEEYLAILKEESKASVELEPGVIVIFPMFQKEDPTQIRLLEIYADREAYETHLQTPHFKHYKSTTLPMVRSLKLVDMTSIDPNTMPEIFTKLR